MVERAWASVLKQEGEAMVRIHMLPTIFLPLCQFFFLPCVIWGKRERDWMRSAHLILLEWMLPFWVPCWDQYSQFTSVWNTEKLVTLIWNMQYKVQNVWYTNGLPNHMTLPFEYGTPILSISQMNCNILSYIITNINGLNTGLCSPVNFLLYPPCHMTKQTQCHLNTLH